MPIIRPGLLNRIHEYRSYYNLPPEAQRGQLWLKYDLNQLLADILAIYHHCIIAESEISKGQKILKGVTDE